MGKLKDRLQEVMDELGWTYADLVAKSGESRSVVSQWLGRGSKEIKSIGKIETAERLSAASGYAAVWLAKGIGQKRLADDAAATPPSAEVANDQAATSIDRALPVVLEALGNLTDGQWRMVRARLDDMAGHPEMRDDVAADVLPLLAASQGKRMGAPA